jgi:hypothetical protein
VSATLPILYRNFQAKASAWLHDVEGEDVLIDGLQMIDYPTASCLSSTAYGRTVIRYSTEGEVVFGL